MPLREKWIGYDSFMYLPLLHDDSYLVRPPKADLHSWEETAPLEILQSPCELLEDKKHFGGEECNIPILIGIFNFILFCFFKE